MYMLQKSTSENFTNKISLMESLARPQASNRLTETKSAVELRNKKEHSCAHQKSRKACGLDKQVQTEPSVSTVIRSASSTLQRPEINLTFL